MAAQGRTWRGGRAAVIRVLVLGVALVAGPAGAGQDRWQKDGQGLAADGYDVVAYFTDGRPVAGSAEHEATWDGVRWRFASAAHLATFLERPERYAPQYGGYCAWAVSQGYTAHGDPRVWKVVNGKLYLNYSRSVQRTWEKDIPGHIAGADRNWPGVLSR